MLPPVLVAGWPAGATLFDWATAEPAQVSWVVAIVIAAAPRNWRRLWLMSLLMVSLRGWEGLFGASAGLRGHRYEPVTIGEDQPKVKAKASAPGSTNSISNSRSPIGFCCRIN